jgi:hypothetical protein
MLWTGRHSNSHAPLRHAFQDESRSTLKLSAGVQLRVGRLNGIDAVRSLTLRPKILI